MSDDGKHKIKAQSPKERVAELIIGWLASDKLTQNLVIERMQLNSENIKINADNFYHWYLDTRRPVGVPTFFTPKIPAKPFLYWGRSGKRSNSGKAISEKRLYAPHRRAFHEQDTFFAGSRTRIFTIKASSSFQVAIASPKMRFLAGILGVKNVGTPDEPCADR